MARIAHPRYFTEKKAYAAAVRGKRVLLLKGEESDANFRAAQKTLRQVLKGSRNDTTAAALHVADVIERYLKLHQAQYSERPFAEEHGWRKVNDRDCLPVHGEEWVASHPEWKREWTKAQVINTVLRPFNWVAKKRIRPAKPFRGVEKTQGEPRRPL